MAARHRKKAAHQNASKTPETPVKTGKPGPAPTDLESERRAEFVDLLRRGFGVQMACTELKIGYARYARTVRNDREFRQAVKHAMTYRRENLVALCYAEAMGGDIKSLHYMIGRDDNAERFRRDRSAARKAAREAAEKAKDQPEASAFNLAALDTTGLANLLGLLGQLVPKKDLP